MADTHRPQDPQHEEHWPSQAFADWKDTLATLHRYTQIVGKVRMQLSPMVNHWWQVALHVTSCGLTTTPIPVRNGSFQIDFDFLAHELQIRTSRGERVEMALEARPVAEFYRDVMASLRGVGVAVRINETPQEIPDDLTPFSEDRHHASYDPEAVGRWFQALVQVDSALKAFRAGFTGKCSPVHFFWGSFDLAVTRFSGRPATPPKGGINAEAYCEEVSSAGFWPGTPELGGACLYSYAVPQPKGFENARGLPDGAYYDAKLKEFLLPWEAVRSARDPWQVMQAFCDSTYVAAAELGKWDRAMLERPLLAEPPREAVPLEADRTELT
jgi:hypothetical protein